MYQDQAVAGMLVDGALDRPIDALAGWPVPFEATCDGDLIQYRFWSDDAGPVPRTTAQGDELLEAFLSLAGADAPALAAFASRFGVLDLCHRHGLPNNHGLIDFGREPLAEGKREVKRCPVMRAVGPDGFSWRSERVVDWLKFADQAAAGIHLASQLHQKRLGPDEEWRRLATLRDPDMPWWPGPIYKGRWRLNDLQPPETLAEGRALLAHWSQEWLLMGNVTLTLRWEEEVRLALEPVSLFGAIALQTSFAVARTNGLAFCSSCSKPFLPRRRRKPELRAYCDSCGRGAAMRDANRAMRERKRKERQNDGT